MRNVVANVGDVIRFRVADNDGEGVSESACSYYAMVSF